MKKMIVACCVLLASAAANADLIQLTPDLVMTGESSAFPDGVWVRVPGQVGHANCFYAPGNVSLFYAKPNGVADPKKVLALLMSAKLAGKTVYVDYAPDGVHADFYSFGISRCEIRRIAIG